MSVHQENAYHNAQRQFDIAADILNLDPGYRKLLRVPHREFAVNFPVKMDDGRIEMFTGYRVRRRTRLVVLPKGASAIILTPTLTKSAPWRC
jgi:hypothetical protein